MKKINPNFLFPNSINPVIACIDKLCKIYWNVCDERIVDYCVNQVYFLESLNIRRNIYISFNQKAIDRYLKQTEQVRYYQDLWLKEIGLSRDDLLSVITKKDNSLNALVNPEYEERTKLRLLNKEAGYTICKLSTYLWNPFSKACNNCVFITVCKELTRKIYPELFDKRLIEREKLNGE